MNLNDNKNKNLVTEKCLTYIDILNSLPYEEITNERLFILKTYGNDFYSKLKESELLELVTKSDYNKISNKIESKSDILKTLRWIGRGLNTELAIKKTISDSKIYSAKLHSKIKEEEVLNELYLALPEFEDSINKMISASTTINIKINKTKSNKTSSKKEVKSATYWQKFEDDWKVNSDKYVILDTETTGLNDDDQVIQLTIIDLKGKTLINSYFYTDQPVHWAAQKVHNISNKTIKKAPKWTNRWAEIEEILKNKIILAHNKSFDLRLIEQTCDRHNIKIDFDIQSACTLEYSRYKYSIGKLSEVARHLGVKFNSNELHNSLVDCNLCLHVINPNNELFETREKAKKYFDLVCDYKIKNGDKKGRDKGLAWIKNTFNIDKVNFNLMDLDTCNSIIIALEKAYKFNL